MFLQTQRRCLACLNLVVLEEADSLQPLIVVERGPLSFEEVGF